MGRFFVALTGFFLLGGCVTPPDVQTLKDQNAALAAQLASAKQQVNSLASERKELGVVNAELKRVMSILDTEKSSRVVESTELRMKIRNFTQKQIDGLKEFLVESNLLDYVGSELFERSQFARDPLVLVDFANPVPRDGSLMGVTGYFAEPTTLTVNVLRQVNDRYVVVWQSQNMEVSLLGQQRLRFPVSVGVEKNDVIAYDFSTNMGVNYDEGTGQTLYSNRSFLLGATVAPSSLKGKNEKRAYSLGVVAILK